MSADGPELLALALSLARGMPYDAANERTLRLLTRALQQAVHMSGEMSSEDDHAVLLEQIVQYSGRASVEPGAVASRTAELDADLDKLRATGDGEEYTASA